MIEIVIEADKCLITNLWFKCGGLPLSTKNGMRKCRVDLEYKGKSEVLCYCYFARDAKTRTSMEKERVCMPNICTLLNLVIVETQSDL